MDAIRRVLALPLAAVGLGNWETRRSIRRDILSRRLRFFSPSMQRRKRNHALRKVQPCTCASPSMDVAESNHASLRVHGSVSACPSIEYFFGFLTLFLAQRAISTPIQCACALLQYVIWYDGGKLQREEWLRRAITCDITLRQSDRNAGRQA